MVYIKKSYIRKPSEKVMKFVTRALLPGFRSCKITVIGNQSQMDCLPALVATLNGHVFITNGNLTLLPLE